MKAMINKAKKTAWGATAMAAVIALAPVAKAQTLRPYIGGDESLWSASGSWLSGIPAATGDHVSFRTTATGANVFDLASGFTLTNIGVGSRTIDNNAAANPATTTLNLNNRVLNANNLYVGQNFTGANTTWLGNLTLTDGTFQLEGGVLVVGVRTGNTTGAHADGTISGSSSLVANAVDLTSFQVAITDHQGGAGVGTVDFSTVADGTLSVAGTETATDRVVIGGRIAGGSGGSGTSGTVILGDDWGSTTFGTSKDLRVNMLVGYRSGNASVAGSFTQSGGTFTAYLNNWDIGYSPSGDTPTVTGTMDLSGVSALLIDATTLRLASRQANHTGTVTLPKGNATVGTATIGGGASGVLNLTHTVFTATTSLTLGTTGRVRATIGTEAAGIVLKNADTTALVINNSITTIANDRGILLTFAAPPPGYTKGTAGDHSAIHWGLKWEGADRTAALSTFKTANKLAWNDDALDTALGADAVGIFHDAATTSTYVGVYLKKLPDPGTVVLLR